MRIDPLRWATGAFCSVVGAVMLVAPHQFAAPGYRVFEPDISLWGAAFLLAGAGLLAAVGLATHRWLAALAHLLAGAVLILLAAGFAGGGAAPPVVVYGVLGLGTAAAPILPTDRRETAAGRDLLALVVAISAVLLGATLIVWPGGLQPATLPPDAARVVRAAAQDAEHLAFLRSMRPRSAVVVPLVARAGRLGALSLTVGPSGRRYGAADVTLAEDLAGRAAVAIDNARLYGATRAAEERLRSVNAELEGALRSRDDFLSVAAHELKTPVTSLRGFAELLLRQIEQRGRPDPALVERASGRVREQTRKLARLVEQLLDFSRIQAGRLAVEVRETDLVALVAEAVAAARAAAPDRVFALAAPPVLPARVDGLRVEQVLTNLLDNAVKYSPAGAPVEVAVEEAGPAAAHIAVRDRGPGVAPADRPHLFDRSYRAPTVRHVSGLGLGLHISRQIVELHGGRLWAEFPEDGGTRMVVRLPVE